MADANLDEILSDARWLAHSYDRERDAVNFVWLPREAHRTSAFLTHTEVAVATPRRAIARSRIKMAAIVQAPLHLVVHSGLTGSTQLAHALDREGVSMALSEPPILTNVVSYRLAGASAEQTAELLDDVLTLLARPFTPGEHVIVKMGAVANVLSGEIMARRPSSKAICLHLPLPTYLASIARKGLEGRLWARKLFGTLRSARLTGIGFTDEEFFEHSDLQIAADCWLVLHGIMGATARRFADRVSVADGEAMITQPAVTVAAIARHFGCDLDTSTILGAPGYTRHSKTGYAFDPERRAMELSAAAAANREEIDMVVDWTRKVADANRIAWTLPAPLVR